jgi:CBS domain containing-hemolysin-like protein
MAIELILAIGLVCLNAFFVAAEFAIARLRPTQAEEFVRQGRPGARSTLHAVQHIDSYLSACQLGITISSLALGAVGEPAFHDLLEPVFGKDTRFVGFGLASLIAFTVITVLHVVLGELAPKSAAISRTVPVALALAPLMRGFYLVTRPLVDLLNGLGNLVLKPFGIPPASEAGHAPHSEDELRELLRESSLGGLIRRDEQQLSERALVFGDRRAREIMRPRSEIDYVTTADDLRTIAEVAVRRGRTRLPVCEPEGGLESAVGVINAKDLLRVAVLGEQVSIRELLRPLARVPESTRVDEVLRAMRRERRHIALVVDEHGTVTGLLTLEDVIEEIVGEIEDEFDPAEAELVQRDGDALRIDGSAPVRLVAERLGVELDVPHEATISGHLLETLGRLPEVGEVVPLDGVPLEVTRVDATRIAELRAPAPVTG